MSLPLITRSKPDLSEWSLALETERALGYGRSLKSKPNLDEGRALDGDLSLTTNHPHLCSGCNRYVHSEFVEIRVDRKVWVFCGKPCRQRWDEEHPSVSKVGSAEPLGARS